MKQLSNETPATMNKQQEFYECPECAAIVEHVYQDGICRACLNKKLKVVRHIIDRNHILATRKFVAT